MKKIYLQCGYEDKCKKKDCMKCRFKYNKYVLNLTLAEQIVIEDFAVCDLEDMIKNKKDELELMQKIMYKLMKKVYREEKGK